MSPQTCGSFLVEAFKTRQDDEMRYGSLLVIEGKDDPTKPDRPTTNSVATVSHRSAPLPTGGHLDQDYEVAGPENVSLFHLMCSPS